MRLLAPDICAFGDSLTIVLRTRRSTYLPSVVVVTVLFSSGVRERFEGLIESEEEFSHHCGESQLVGFTFGAQTLVKARQDRVEASGRECSHVEAAAQSAASTEDGAFAAD